MEYVYNYSNLRVIRGYGDNYTICCDITFRPKENYMNNESNFELLITTAKTEEDAYIAVYDFVSSDNFENFIKEEVELEILKQTKIKRAKEFLAVKNSRMIDSNSVNVRVAKEIK